ncbi:hypothetical protein M0657_003911 [Pyricularia oryzae]|uniref:Uncharacterized protein n=2 Tax=Pyricularia oryzae TaxID=318829 RepID=A0A4P7NH67_PYROR|nr:hypothetical protein OOU_Y34scaffold00247g61 [Pyricularia oryzae Y34]KAI7925369.1 hypothetical protein M9X92_003354 [Pyricularia oryzae]KAI7925939.1 hypothetical protein M0657_003911 [Pyricularia oryzae]QBZ61317.1 hypothetical protein PoMZ_08266 [Pyricularia oryzae]
MYAGGVRCQRKKNPKLNRRGREAATQDFCRIHGKQSRQIGIRKATVIAPHANDVGGKAGAKQRQVGLPTKPCRPTIEISTTSTPQPR